MCCQLPAGRCPWADLLPHSAQLWLSLRDPFQGDAIVTGTIPVRWPLGLLMGSQPEQAPRAKCVKHPQVLCFSEVWPPNRLSATALGPFMPLLGELDTGTDVVLGGTFALEEAKRKTQAMCLWEGICLINRAGSLRV